MIKKAEELKPGDRRLAGAEEWVVEAAELQEGLMQVLWRRGEERQWSEYAPENPLLVEPAPEPQRVRLIKIAAELAPGDVRIGSLKPPYVVSHVERSSDRVVVEWTNGSAI
ncbi:MAG TPA: hypothetical protein VFR81_25480, partial [Longimicrobium sp.]|nr:hypothetical protein [Longimicrobium sp.]